jgi:hypothetical protein
VGGKNGEIQPRARACKSLEIADADDVGRSCDRCRVRPQRRSAGAERGGASDIEYCHALSHTYSYMWSNNEGMPVAEAFTLGQCDTDTQKTIATLEKRMKD